MEYGTHLLNDRWAFALLPLSAKDTPPAADAFTPVALPHDWLIAHTDNLYADGNGWYRRTLLFDGAADCGDLAVSLRFEGVYMDATVYLNGQLAAAWKYGYSTFDVDLTPWLTPGENEILVRVAYQAPNSRWYSGAGIYRDVWLTVARQAAALVPDGTYYSAAEQPGGGWRLTASTEVAVKNAPPSALQVAYRLLPPGGGAPVLAHTAPVEPAADGGYRAHWDAVLDAPALWDTTHPNCYRLEVRLVAAGVPWQCNAYTVGFRTLCFTPDEGFLLNHRKCKLNGVCEHHDLGCLGAAYNQAAMRRKLQILRGMGVNALRLTHNMPAPDVMELADELGFLVISEAFDMWETSKTPYDYARFFPQWYQKDVASWVRRDRNHPCLLMWSIGNEIYDTHVSARGQELTRLLMDEVRLHDPRGNAPITIGSNYMPWENAQKCADLVKLAGYNYAEKYYAAHHAAHPDWVIYGSETASVVSSRGIYHFPFSQPLLADVDEQCSALGNSATSWGAKSPEYCLLAERDHPYSCGQFLWTGFDYIGEPTPYHTRNSYFGQVDTAGFPKDSYYLYQAEWTDGKTAPMVHLFPYWDFNAGQLIDVRACSNAARVELFLNGQSCGAFDIDHRHGTQLVGHWQLPYTPGTLLACAYDEAGREVARDCRRSFGEAAALQLQTDRDSLKGDGRDMAFFSITVQDADGNPVENAVDRVRVQVSGAGYLAGLDNGDSTDADGYKTDNRRLFSGKLMAAVVSDGTAGNVTVTVEGAGLAPAALTLPVVAAPIRPGTGLGAYRAVLPQVPFVAEHPVRAIRLQAAGGTALNAAHRATLVTATLCPPQAGDRAVRWCLVDDKGVPSDLAALTPDGLSVTVTAQSDGAFRLRCLSNAGTQKVRVISELNFTVTGLGKCWRNPYGFIPGAVYDYSQGELGNGNEHGVATARGDESQVGFRGIDFGPFGADTITLPIFAMDSDTCPLQIYEGMPGEPGSALVADVVYQKPHQWNVYQSETFRLNKRLKGVTSLCFVVRQKIHLKGFSFLKEEKAYARLTMADCTKVYGDSFTRTANSIDGIGNNVTILFDGMDFGPTGAGHITICGATPLEKNAIQLRFAGAQGDSIALVEFTHTAPAAQRFEIPRICGAQSVSFVFLPGSNFDFKWFMFERE